MVPRITIWPHPDRVLNVKKLRKIRKNAVPLNKDPVFDEISPIEDT